MLRGEWGGIPIRKLADFLPQESRGFGTGSSRGFGTGSYRGFGTGSSRGFGTGSYRGFGTGSSRGFSRLNLVKLLRSFHIIPNFFRTCWALGGRQEPALKQNHRSMIWGVHASFNLVKTWLLVPRVETKLIVFALVRQFPANKMTQHFLENFRNFCDISHFSRNLIKTFSFQPYFNLVLIQF